MTTMTLERVTQQESAEDVFFGQVVILAARYSLVLGLLAVVLRLQESWQMVMAVVPAVIFLAMNFFLHARYLMGQPANLRLIALTSAVDLLLVTGIVMFGPGLTGSQSPFFVLYYPLVLAFAFVVPRRIEIAYTSAAILLFAGAVLVTDPSTLWNMVLMKALVLRLITLAACGGIANYYWRTLRARRRSGARVPVAA